MSDEITTIMARHGWADLWYANPFPPGGYSQEDADHFGPRWHCGVWAGLGRAGPDNDLLCVRWTDDVVEARSLMSPPGWTPLEAAQLAQARLGGA